MRPGIEIRMEADGGYAAYRGQENIARDNDAQWKISAIQAWRIARLDLPDHASIAVIGGGTCCLPRLLNLRSWSRLDIYEIEYALIRWVKATWPESARWNFYLGDYRRTLRDVYDVIAYDLGEEPDHDFLMAHLDRGGVLFIGTSPALTRS